MSDKVVLSEKLKRITLSLHKIIECPVCLESIKLPFKQCARGHCICSDCTKNVEVCPLCHDLFTLINPICLKNLLEALPKFCCYVDNGCEDVIEEGDDHEMFCGYRPYTCRVCVVKLPICKLLDHYNGKHPESFVIKQANMAIISKIFISKKERTDVIPVSLFNNLFLFILKNDIEEKQLQITFEANPIGKMVDDYYVCAKFQKGNFNYCYTIKACISKDESNASDDKDVENFCMKVPQSSLIHFINKNGDLAYDLVFFTVKKQ